VDNVDGARHLAASNVALVLAAGMVFALNIITIALLIAAFHVDPPELSANGTQLLTGWGGGIIGVLGSYIGFTFGSKRDTAAAAVSTRATSAPQPQSMKGQP
jgi:hypothetical protein